MAHILKSPGDAGFIHARHANRPVVQDAGLWVLIATILGSSLSFIDGTAVNVALPSLQRDFGATVADVQWVIEAYALFLAALILVGGSLGDRLGRRRIYSIGIIVFTLASIGCGIAPSVQVLIFSRALQGVGGALLVPGSLAIISASFEQKRRGAAIGTWAGWTTVTSAVGPVFGGWLVQSVSWRAVFFINVPLAAITLAITFWRVPESRDEALPENIGGIDWWGSLLVTLGLGLVVYGLIESSTLGLGAPVVLLALVLGVVALAAFVVVEQRVAEPLVPLSLFRVRTFSGANLLTLLLYGGLAGALYFLPFNLQQVQGYSAAAAGAALLPMTVIIFALSRWSGGLVTRYGAKLPLIIGPCIVAVGFLLFAFSGIHGSYWLSYFPAVIVLSLGMSLVIAPLTTSVMNAVATEHSGTASGINNAVSRTAGLIAIAVLNLIFVAVFDRSLDGRLAQIPLSPAVRSAFDAQRSRLAAAQAPGGVSSSVANALHQAVGYAFVDGFRAAMLIGAGLAFASALAAAWLIDGRPADARATTVPATGTIAQPPAAAEPA